MKNTGRLFGRLARLMERLRGKGGCPWDRAQTHKSLRPYLIEETCEVLEGIDRKNPKMLMDELGDLLYQVLFHAQIAKERGRFSIDDVLENSYKKLRHRHPHVFGGVRLKTPSQVINRWHRLKKNEYKRVSVLSGIPVVLPSLLMAGKVQDKAARAGFDWENTEDVLKKAEEEFEELKSAVISRKPSHIREEFGDLLFSMVNLARFLDIEPETALRDAVNKFTARFRKMEKALFRKGRPIEECTMEEMDAEWAKAKT